MMSQSVRRIFVLTMSALVLTLGTELLLPQPGGSAVPRAVSIRAAASDSGMADAVSQWGGVVLARPLFNADRRPVEEAQTGGDMPRLEGIIVTGGARSAIFTDDSGKSQIIPEGGAVDGYQLRKITPDGVQLLGPGSPVTLHPQFAAPSSAALAGSNNS
jgi:hypothetical protein